MHFEFEQPTWCVLATYLVHDDGETPTSYEFVSCRRRKLTNDNWRRKLKGDLGNARLYHEDEHIVVVAYESLDESKAFEDNSYAVLAIESEHPLRPTVTHILWEIPEEIENW